MLKCRLSLQVLNVKALVGVIRTDPRVRDIILILDSPPRYGSI